MIADALEGEFQLILTKEVSRFARNTVDALSYTRKLKEHKVGVLFLIDNIDTRDSDGELRLTIMASMAQEESRKTSERVKWGQKRRMEQGVVFGRDLLGYHVEGGRLYIDEEEAALVQMIFQKYTEEGKSTHVIARELNEQGIPSKNGGVWSNVTILRVLKNEKYVGDLCQKKTVTLDYLTHKKSINRGEEALICISQHHPPIISRELWERTLEERKRRAISQNVSWEGCHRYSNKSWCSGKIICQGCKHHYIRKIRKRKDGSIYQSWKCSLQVKNGRQSGCANQAVNEQTLLACMGFILRQILESQDSMETEVTEEILRELQSIKPISRPEQEKNQLHKSITELKHKKRQLIDLALEGIITKEDLKSQTQWYEEKLIACQLRLQRLMDSSDSSDQTLKSFSKLPSESTLPGSTLPDSTLPDSVIPEATLSKKMSPEATIHKILTQQLPCDFLYGELLEQIHIHHPNQMTICIKTLSEQFCLTYATRGRMEHYVTEITNCSVPVTRL